MVHLAIKIYRGSQNSAIAKKNMQMKPRWHTWQ